MAPISKSTFLQYQICPKDTWLRLHKPELVKTFTLTEFEKHLLEQGNEVEACARQLYPGAVLVSATGDAAVEDADSGDGGQAFHLKADSESGRSRTAIR